MRPAVAMSLLVLLVLSSPARPGVLVVDASGGGDFTFFVDAVDASAEGDILLVKPGQYASTALFARVSHSLTIVGDGETRPVLPIIDVDALPAGGQIVLRHLEIVSTAVALFFGGSCAVSESDGSVVIEDCVLRGQDGGGSQVGSSAGMPGLSVDDSSSVVVVRTTITGGQGVSTVDQYPILITNPAGGGAAMSVSESRVSLYDVTATGGTGGSDFNFGNPGTDGGSGLSAVDSRLWIVGSTFVGGDAGQGTGVGAPGAGLRLSGAPAELYELDSSWTAGAGGLDLDVTGTHVAWPGQAVGFSMPSPVRPGETGTIDVDGPPGTLFGVFYSFGGGFLPKASFQGVFVPAVAAGGPLFVATIPPSGTFTLPFRVPVVTGFDGFTKVDQVLTSQGADGLVLGSAGTYVQVDTGF